MQTLGYRNTTTLTTRLSVPIVLVRVHNRPAAVGGLTLCSSIVTSIDTRLVTHVSRMIDVNIGHRGVVVSPNFNFTGGCRRRYTLLSRLKRLRDLNFPVVFNVSHGHFLTRMLAGDNVRTITAARTVRHSAIKITTNVFTLRRNTDVVHARGITVVRRTITL